MLIVDRDRASSTSSSRWTQPGGAWHAGSGAIWRMDSNEVRPEGWTSADAAGLPISPASRATTRSRGGGSTTRSASPSAGRGAPTSGRRGTSRATRPIPGLPPMGLRVRLKASYPIAGFPPQARVVLQALKEYGMIVADNGSNWFVSGAPHPEWSNDQLHTLHRVPGSAFEVVDASRLPPAIASARARAARPARAPPRAVLRRPARACRGGAGETGRAGDRPRARQPRPPAAAARRRRARRGGRVPGRRGPRLRAVRRAAAPEGGGRGPLPRRLRRRTRSRARGGGRAGHEDGARRASRSASPSAGDGSLLPDPGYPDYSRPSRSPAPSSRSLPIEPAARLRRRADRGRRRRLPQLSRRTRPPSSRPKASSPTRSPSPSAGRARPPRLRLRRPRLRRPAARELPRRARRAERSASSSSRCRRATGWRAGGSASSSATPSSCAGSSRSGSRPRRHLRRAPAGRDRRADRPAGTVEERRALYEDRRDRVVAALPRRRAARARSTSGCAAGGRDRRADARGGTRRGRARRGLRRARRRARAALARRRGRGARRGLERLRPLLGE